MSRRAIEGCYARLKGLQSSIFPLLDYAIDESYHHDYNSLLSELRSCVDDKFVGLDLPSNAIENLRSEHYRGIREPLKSKVNQLINYMEAVHQASNRIVEIGSVYNLIKDEELKSRCADLLSARDHFDRVINQATQVLEERIRAKVPRFASEVGTSLINKAIKSDLQSTPLKFSENPSEQEGYAAILRGLVGAFRNPSHHRFLTEVSREQALQICAFIDNMLSALEKAEVIDQS